jgi:hypothetical protein
LRNLVTCPLNALFVAACGKPGEWIEPVYGRYQENRQYLHKITPLEVSQLVVQDRIAFFSR